LVSQEKVEMELPMCRGCGIKDECGRGLYEIIFCFLYDLNEAEKIYIPNGSSGIFLADAIYNLLRKYSTDEEERRIEACTPKPSDFLESYLRLLVKGGDDGDEED